MVLFSEMRNDIPLVDFAKVLEETLIIYSTTPHSVFDHFHKIDESIQKGDIINGIFHFSDYYFSITPSEFVTICSTDLKNILIVDVSTVCLFNLSALIRSKQELSKFTESMELVFSM